MLERIGRHVDPETLWRRIRRSVIERDGWATKRGKSDEWHRSIWRLDLHEGVFFVVVDERNASAVTIVPEGYSLRTRCKGGHKRRRKVL